MSIIYMGRKKGPDIKKLKRIRKVLVENPQGLWIREIARKAGLNRMTVSIYISKYMEHEVETVFPVEGGLIKIVRLRK